MPNIKINFRGVSSDDYQAICALIPSEEELFMVYPRGTYPFTVEQLDALAQSRRALTVATLDGRIAAFANLYDFEDGRFAFIGNIVVDKACRGRGIGKVMVAHMLEIAYQQYHLPEVRISVFANNTAALLLYAGFGFSPCAIEERSDPKGKRVALVHMRK